MSFQSTAAQILVALIPIVAIAFAAVLVFFALLWRHKEIKIRMSKDTYKPAKFNFKAFSLLFGMCLTGVGFVLSLLFYLIEGVSWCLLGGLIPLSLGISMILFYKINPDYRQPVNRQDNED